VQERRRPGLAEQAGPEGGSGGRAGPAGAGPRLTGRVSRGARPTIPSDCPLELSSMIQRCWQTQAVLRPSFSQASLQAGRGGLGGRCSNRMARRREPGGG
jgi:hypothetical protein